MHFKKLMTLAGLVIVLLAWTTHHAVAQDATCSAIQIDTANAQPGDVIGITGLPDDLAQVDVGWIDNATDTDAPTVIIYADATFDTIPDPDAETDENTEADRPLAVLMPLHPNFDPAGGAGVLDIEIAGVPCAQLDLTMAPITFEYDDPQAELDEIRSLMETIRQQTAELNGIDRDLLADMDAATLPPELQAMQGYDRIYAYLLTLLDGTAPEWIDPEDGNLYDVAAMRYVLAVGDTLGMLRTVAASVESYEPLPDDMSLFSLATQPVEVVSLNGIYTPPQTYMQVDVTNMSVEQVAFYMRRANHARRQLNGEVGSLINNTGFASVVAGAGESKLLGPASTVIGTATFFAKSEIEMRKFMSGPERFLSLSFEAEPLEYENEDDTTTGLWFQVEAVVARDPWNITPKIYDTARLFPVIGEAGGLAATVVDALGNTSANPVELLPAIEIGEETWRVNLSQRLSGNYAETLRYIRPRVIPINGRQAIQLNPEAAEYTPYLAGRSRLMIQINAPIFGNPPGGNTQTFRIITVNEMEFNVTSASLGPFNPGDEVCVSGTEMENINDEGLSWQARGERVSTTGATSSAGESFCMTIPSTLENNNTWNTTTCSAPSDEVYRYTIEATSIATNGARNPSHGPQERTDSFDFDVRIESDDPRPADCEPTEEQEEVAPLNERAAWHASGFGSAPMCNNLIRVNNLQDLIIEVYPNEVVRVDAPIELYFDGGSSLPTRMRPFANYHGDPAITLNVTNGTSDKTLPFLANRLNNEWQNFIWHQWRFARIPGESWLIARYEQYQVWEAGTVCTGYTAYILTPGVERPDDLNPYVDQAIDNSFFQSGGD